MAYGVAILEFQEFSKTFVLVNAIEILRYASSKYRTLRRLAIYSRLCIRRFVTSAEHLATASANLSIGLVLPGIIDRDLQSRPGKSKRNRSVADSRAEEK